MIDKFSRMIAHTLVEQTQIQQEEEIIYAYLFASIGEEVGFDVVVLILGSFLKHTGISLCYLLVTTPLRHFAGGFHANTRFGCTVLSYGIFLAIILICPIVVPIYRLLWIVIYSLCWIIIYILAPVDTANKRIPPETRVLLRHRCLITFIIMTILYLYLIYQQSVLYYGSISVCMLVCACGLIIGVYKNKHTGSLP